VTALLPTLHPALGPLLAQYARGDEGAAIVLCDAMMENATGGGAAAAIKVSDQDTPIARIENVVLLLSPDGQKKLGAECVKKALDRVLTKIEAANARVLEEALAKLSDGASELKSRQQVFQVWRGLSRASAPREVALPVWAVWMLMRDMPLVALASLRSIGEKEAATQIETIGQMLS